MSNLHRHYADTDRFVSLNSSMWGSFCSPNYTYTLIWHFLTISLKYLHVHPCSKNCRDWKVSTNPNIEVYAIYIEVKNINPAIGTY